jgi:hypothetical protein
MRILAKRSMIYEALCMYRYPGEYAFTGVILGWEQNTGIPISCGM